MEIPVEKVLSWVVLCTTPTFPVGLCSCRRSNDGSPWEKQGISLGKTKLEWGKALGSASHGYRNGPVPGLGVWKCTEGTAWSMSCLDGTGSLCPQALSQAVCARQRGRQQMGCLSLGSRDQHHFQRVYGVQRVSGMSKQLGSGVPLGMHRAGFVTGKISPSCLPRGEDESGEGKPLLRLLLLFRGLSTGQKSSVCRWGPPKQVTLPQGGRSGWGSCLP